MADEAKRSRSEIALALAAPVCELSPGLDSGEVTRAVRPRGLGGLAQEALPVVVLAALALFALRERAYVFVDDSYIAFRYAANFAAGHGLVWNPGEHVEGYTNLLWVVLLSGFAKLGLDLTIPGAATSFLCAAASVVMTGRLARRMKPDGGALGVLLPGMLLATNSSFDHAASSAMETSCFGLLTLLALDLLIRSRERPGLRFGAAACFCAAYLTRPEGVLVAGIALTVEALLRPGPFFRRVRDLAPIAIAVVVVAAVHVAARLAYYGYPLPNTYYAKVILGNVAAQRGAAHFGGFLLAGGFIAFAGALELERKTPLLPWIIHGYCLLFGYVAYVVFVGGDHPNWYRFYVPLLPLPLLATSQLAVRVAERLRAGSAARSATLWRALGVAGALGLILVPRTIGYRFAEHGDVIGRAEPGYRAVANDIARFFREEAPAGSLVAALPVGHVGYYARNVRILDMWGLNDVHIAHLDVPPMFKSGHDKYDPWYVIAQKPDYAYMFRYDVPAPVPVMGYDICWPSQYFPFVIYRRNFPLAPNERTLGVPKDHPRYLQTPPPCRPPPP